MVFCLLRLLPQALANKNCSGTQLFGLRLRDQRSLTMVKKRSPPTRAAISHLLQTGQAAKRNLALAKEIKQLQESEDNLLKQKSEGKQKETAQTQIIPVAQHILESYPILSLEEKNRLWKLVLKKATIYRSPDNEVTIRICPNLPK